MHARWMLAAALVLLAQNAAAQPFESATTVVINASAEAVWGRLLRFALRDQLETVEDRRVHDEAVRLHELRRDLGLAEIEIEQHEVYSFRVHLADESRPAESAKDAPTLRVSARIYGSGRQRVSLANYQKLLVAVLTSSL